MEEDMRKLCAIPIWCCLALILMFTPAKANDSKTGIYAGVKLIDSIQSAWLAELSHTQNTIGGGIFVGYDLYPRLQMPLRVEIEYALRSNLHYDDTFNASGGFVNSSIDASYVFNAQTLLANLYFDFHNSTAFTPYVGAGLGFGFTTETIELDANGNFDGVSYNGSGSATSYNTNFAWQVGAGVAYSFNELMAADLGYRYMSFGVSDIDFLTNADTFASAHEISLGLRLNF